LGSRGSWVFPICGYSVDHILGIVRYLFESHSRAHLPGPVGAFFAQMLTGQGNVCFLLTALPGQTQLPFFFKIVDEERREREGMFVLSGAARHLNEDVQRISNRIRYLRLSGEA